MKHPLTLIVGDSFLASERFKALASEYEKKSPGGFSSQAFYLKETPLKSVLSQARTLPFGVSRQLFRVLEAGQLKKDDVETLEAYAAHPAPSTDLIFFAEDLDAKSALLAFFQNTGEVIRIEEGQKLSASSRLIKERLQQAGKTMRPEAIRRVEDKAGEYPAFVDSLLTQLISYAGDAAEISLEMLEQFEENLSSVDIYKLMDAISAGKLQESLTLFNRYLEENEKEFLSFMGLLHWQFRRLWQASVLLEEGASESAVLKKCKVYNPNQSRMFLQQVRAFSRARLEKGIEGLFQLDWALKSGRAEERSGFERWLVELSA